MPPSLVALSIRLQELPTIDDVVSADSNPVTGWDVVIAIAVLGASWPVGSVLARITRRFIRRATTGPDYISVVAGRIVKVVTIVTGLAVALRFLGLNVAWLTISVILLIVVFVLMMRPLIENLASGLLLHTRPSFAVGDEIETNDYEGEVVEINTRTTVLETRDKRRIHIPNNDVLSSPITVYTAFDRRRSELELEIQYDADIDQASKLLVQAASAVEGVHADPPPFIRARGFGTATYVLSLRWWHDPELRADTRTLDGVVREVKRVLDDAGIGLPSPEVIVRQPDRRTD